MSKNYDLTIGELLEQINKALESLKGKNPTKVKGGISKLAGDALKSMDIDLWDYLIEQEACLLKIYVSGLGEDIVFAHISATYKPDKRKALGVGDVIESASVKLIKDLPLELSVIDGSQWLGYEESKRIFLELEQRQEALMEEYKKNLELLEKYSGIMRAECYSEDTKREANDFGAVWLNMLVKKGF